MLVASPPPLAHATAPLAACDDRCAKQCGEVNLNSFAKYSALRDAFNRTGAAVAFSCEPHVTSAIGWLPEVCNQWRTTSDNCRLAVDYSSLPRVLAANNIMAANARPVAVGTCCRLLPSLPTPAPSLAARSADPRRNEATAPLFHAARAQLVLSRQLLSNLPALHTHCIPGPVRGTIWTR